MRAGAAAVVAMICGVATAYAGDIQRIEMPVSAVQCGGGTVLRYDDGEYETGYKVTRANGQLGMKFELPADAVGVEGVCVCMLKGLGGPTTVIFDLFLYDDDGPTGRPGTLLGVVEDQRVTDLAAAGKTVAVSLLGRGISFPDKTFYAVIQWDGQTNSFVCADESLGTTPRTGHASSDGGATWTDLRASFSGFRALGIRVDPIREVAPPPTCVADRTSMCLAGGRFKVQASYITPQGDQGPGFATPLTDETGYFWFFARTNVEAVIKILNGCPVNDRFWVFAGGLTNVQVSLTVTDTHTGATKTYTNPQGTPFAPIQDTAAFATCN